MLQKSNLARHFKGQLKVQLENTTKDTHHQHHQFHHLLLLKIEHRTSLEL